MKIKSTDVVPRIGYGECDSVSTNECRGDDLGLGEFRIELSD